MIAPQPATSDKVLTWLRQQSLAGQLFNVRERGDHIMVRLSCLLVEYLVLIRSFHIFLGLFLMGRASGRVKRWKRR